MELVDVLSPEGVMAGLKINSKKQLLQELAHRAAALTGLEERDIFDTVVEREKLGTTGIGQGIAIPHGRLAGLDALHGVFVQLDQPVDFESIDDQPVDLVFLLLAPEAAGADHLKALARVSRLLRDRAMCEKLRGADGADAIYALVSESQAQSNAA